MSTINGYNANISFLIGKSENHPIGLFESEIWYNYVSDQLTSLTPHNILRFPGGTITREWNYPESATRQFKNLCDRGGVDEIAFVINVNNVDASLQAALFLKQYVNIILFEFGNEEYMYQTPNNIFELIQSIFNRRSYYRNKGQQYGRKFNTAKSKFREYFPNTPFSAVVQLPNDDKNQGWFQGIKDTVISLTDLVYHPYPEFGENWTVTHDRFYPTLEPYNVWITEVNLKWDDTTRPNAYTNAHKEQLSFVLGYFNSKPSTQLILLHALWGNSKFARYIGVEDMYSGWFN